MKLIYATIALVVVFILSIGQQALAQSVLDPPVTPHSHATENVLWEIDGTKDGDTGHNHMWDRDFGGSNVYSHEPYTAYGCWNNWLFVYQPFPQFELAHCFVEVLSPIPYSFEGSGWTSAREDVLRKAFDEWNELATEYTFAIVEGVSGNRIGIRFIEVPSGLGVIDLMWEDLGDPNLGNSLAKFVPASQDIIFNEHTSIQWDTSTTSGGADDTKYHMLTAALHEVGHAVGLDHQLDFSDVMRSGIANPAPSSTREEFYAVDTDSAHGAYELYGQGPKTAPSPYTFTMPCFCQYIEWSGRI